MMSQDGLIRGRAWLFGDDINTDVMAPGLFFKSPIETLARHCMEAVDPTFASGVEHGDIVVAGKNFGIGSAREQAAMALQHLGVGAVLARSFGRIFYRNALNFGIPALTLPEDATIAAGDRLCIDPLTGALHNETHGEQLTVSAVPEHLMEMVGAGGLIPYLHQRLAREKQS